MVDLYCDKLSAMRWPFSELPFQRRPWLAEPWRHLWKMRQDVGCLLPMQWGGWGVGMGMGGRLESAQLSLLCCFLFQISSSWLMCVKLCDEECWPLLQDRAPHLQTRRPGETSVILPVLRAPASQVPIRPCPPPLHIHSPFLPACSVESGSRTRHTNSILP